REPPPEATTKRRKMPGGLLAFHVDYSGQAAIPLLSSTWMTRRELLSLSALALPAARSAQGQYRSMASAGVRAAPRSKPSGIPFHAHFVNVAKQAGLTRPVIYGDEGHVDYILSAMGCGAAFIDYDNDGWQDIVILTGKRQTGPTPPEATIRLYHNNRDGTF